MWWTDAVARARAPASALLALAVLSACATSATEKDTAKAALLPTEQYSAQVVDAPDQLALTPHAEGLSALQRAALVGLVNRWRETAGPSDLAVQTPAGGDAAVARTSSEVLAALQALGVPANRVRTGDYQPAAGAAPVLASFTRLEAVATDCSTVWDNLTSTGSNRPSGHFGCAQTANLAAQIADPRDLLSPAGVTPADAVRRETVLGKYRKGEVTSTARDEQAQGAVSRAVN